MSYRSNRRLLYLAGPLFSEAERVFNLMLKARLLEFVDVYLPQEDGGLFVDIVRAGVPVEAAARQVFEGDVAAIESSQYLVLIMDGRAIDEGGAFELGYAIAKGKVCVGLQTDMRRLLPIGNNPMISSALSKVFNDIESLILWIKEDLAAVSNDGERVQPLRELTAFRK